MRAAMPRSACSSDDQYLSAALSWVARFPLLGEAEFAALLGADDWTTAAVLREVRRRDMVASVLVDSPEFEASERLFYLTDSGVAALAERMHTHPDIVRHAFPVSRAELLARLARLETAVSVARFVATLADNLRRHGDGITLEEAWSTHWAPRQVGRTDEPPGVEAYGRLRQGAHVAAFALAWDRAAAPYPHRRQRVAAWYRADDLRDAPWGRALPPVLVICADDRLITEWTQAAARSADRRRREALRLAVARSDDLNVRGPLRARWWGPGGGRCVTLLDLLAWRVVPAVSARTNQPESVPKPVPDRPLGPKSPGVPPVVVRNDRSTTTRPHDRARDRLGDAEWWAALTVGLSAMQKLFLEWVAHHPLLPHSHLAIHLRVATRGLEQLVSEIVRYGLVAIDRSSATSGRDDRRYVLTWRGAGYLAARDGVSLRTYPRDGVIAVQGAESHQDPHRSDRWRHGHVRLSDVRRRPEHTAGVYSFALALAQEAELWRARGVDYRLLAWLNAAESQVWFRWKGRFSVIRPDGRFWFRASDRMYDLMLEWDRGVVRRRDYARKFAAYVAYLASQGTPRDDDMRLVVVTTGAAAQRVRAAVVAAAETCGRLAAITYIITQSELDARGIAASLWPEVRVGQPGRAVTVGQPGNGSLV